MIALDFNLWNKYLWVHDDVNKLVKQMGEKRQHFLTEELQLMNIEGKREN